MRKIYFASDFHLGIDAQYSSREREGQIVRWLDTIKDDADEIYLVGDIFDYWFEYKTVVPKGFTRLLGKLAELRDQGVPIYAFTGNHDMWMFGYFEEELDIPVYRAPIQRTLQGKQIMIGHGDGLGPGDHGYKFIKRVFANRIAQRLFAFLHPWLGVRLMKFFSGKSRDMTSVPEFLGEENEWLVQFCNTTLDREHVDYFVFGHRHLPIDHVLKNGKSRYINLGDWLSHYTYGVMENGELKLKRVDLADRIKRS